MVIFAALELVQELAEYLSARYPDTFQVERHIQADVDPKSFIQKGWGRKTTCKVRNNSSSGCHIPVKSEC